MTQFTSWSWQKLINGFRWTWKKRLRGLVNMNWDKSGLELCRNRENPLMISFPFIIQLNPLFELLNQAMAHRNYLVAETIINSNRNLHSQELKPKISNSLSFCCCSSCFCRNRGCVSLLFVKDATTACDYMTPHWCTHASCTAQWEWQSELMNYIRSPAANKQSDTLWSSHLK